MTHSALYLSPRWFDLLQQEAQRALDAAPRPFSAALLERYHGEADRWRVDGYLPGFRIDFANGVARVRPGALPGESADLVLEMSWSDAHRVCAQRGGPGLDELLGAMIADGASAGERRPERAAAGPQRLPRPRERANPVPGRLIDPAGRALNVSPMV